MEGGPLKTVKGELKSIIEKIDANKPKIEEINYKIFDDILNNTDFSKTKNALESLKLFYERMWMHVIYPLEDDLHLYQRENGRLILEADTNRRKAEKYQAENEDLRKRLQEAGCLEAETSS